MTATKINRFEIINNGTQLAIDIETGEDFFTSLTLWDIESFKNPSLGYNLTYKLQQINNIESFIVDASELNISNFQDIYFMETTTEYEENFVLAITYNLQPYYKCMLNFLLESQKNPNCDGFDIYNNEITITVNLLINSIEKSLEIGYYLEAIDMLKKLKKICNISNCKNCKKVICNSCSKSITTIVS